MKINRIDAHDRFEHFTNQSFDIGECCQDLIDKRPFGDHAFYIFAHARTEDNEPDKKRLIWQPRLTKPKAQTNSMLFKAYPGSDNVKIIWMIPARELWDQFQKGKMTQNQLVAESIHDFQHNRSKLEDREEDDPSDAEIDAIYTEISKNAQKKHDRRTL